MDDFMFLVDASEVTNCLTGRSKRKRDDVIMTDLFDPVFSHREEDAVTGTSYQVFKLQNIEKLGISYKVIQLQFGDYIFPAMMDGRTVVKIYERKTVSDLVGSFTGPVKIGSGKGSKVRIDEQLKDDWNLGEQFYGDIEVNLLVEDFYECRFDFSKDNWGVWIPTWKNYKNDKTDREGRPFYMAMGYSRRSVHPNAFLGKIHSLETRGIEVSRDVFKPVNVIKCGGAQHAYDTIMEEILPPVKTRTDGIRPVRRKPRDMPVPDNQIFFLEGLPGFGGGMARKALEKYPVPIDFLNKLVAAKDASEIDIPRFGKRQFEPSRKVLSGNHADLSMEREQ